VHGKEEMTAKTQQAARQRNDARQRPWTLPWWPLCRAARQGARQRLLCRAVLSLPCAIIYFICFYFYFISSNTYIYFLN
jgi:hypothetical protein